MSLPLSDGRKQWENTLTLHLPVFIHRTGFVRSSFNMGSAPGIREEHRTQPASFRKDTSPNSCSPKRGKKKKTSTGCPGPPTCDVGVFEHEQESVAECGAGGLRSREEEGECREDEVLLVELAAGVSFLLNPRGKHRGRGEALLHACPWGALPRFWGSHTSCLVYFSVPSVHPVGNPSPSLCALSWLQCISQLSAVFVSPWLPDFRPL